MRSSSTNSRARKAACVCSILFAGQALWLAALIAVKWGGGEFTKPSRFLDLQTDVLFLVSIVLSVVGTAVNDWGWHNLSEFWKRLPATGTLVSWTLIRRPPASFKEDGQYAVAVVRLDAGVQVTGRLVKPDEQARPGARVTARAKLREIPLFEVDG